MHTQHTRFGSWYVIDSFSYIFEPQCWFQFVLYSLWYIYSQTHQETMLQLVIYLCDKLIDPQPPSVLITEIRLKKMLSSIICLSNQRDTFQCNLAQQWLLWLTNKISLSSKLGRSIADFNLNFPLLNVKATIPLNQDSLIITYISFTLLKFDANV